METSQLPGLAEEFYYKGLDLKCRDIDKAIYNFSVSYGLYRSLEDLDKANLCVEQLKSLGLPNGVIRVCKDWGLEGALNLYNLVDTAREVFNRE